MTIDLETLLKLLPSIIMLVLPGTAFIYLYRFFARRPTKKEKISVEIIILSYVLQLIVAAGFDLVCKKTPSNIEVIIVSAILGVVLGLIRRSQNIEAFIGDSLGVRIEDSIWEAIEDREKGCYVRVFMGKDDLVYKGAYRRYYPLNGDTWIVLQEYSVKKASNCNEDEDIIYSHKGEPRHMVALNTKDVLRVEIIYDKESKKL